MFPDTQKFMAIKNPTKTNGHFIASKTLNIAFWWVPLFNKLCLQTQKVRSWIMDGATHHSISKLLPGFNEELSQDLEPYLSAVLSVLMMNYRPRRDSGLIWNCNHSREFSLSQTLKPLWILGLERVFICLIIIQTTFNSWSSVAGGCVGVSRLELVVVWVALTYLTNYCHRKTLPKAIH